MSAGSQSGAGEISNDVAKTRIRLAVELVSIVTQARLGLLNSCRSVASFGVSESSQMLLMVSAAMMPKFKVISNEWQSVNVKKHDDPARVLSQLDHFRANLTVSL
jgi:hypothetical protein